LVDSNEFLGFIDIDVIYKCDKFVSCVLELVPCAAKIKPFNRKLLFNFSWLCCYLMQMNPLIGPEMSNHTLLVMKKEWGSSWKA